jgi:hypothetical protein
MHGGKKLPPNLSPANGVTVFAYYAIPCNAIVNQCWDLCRIHTLPLSFIVSELFESKRSAFLMAAFLATAAFFFPASS